MLGGKIIETQGSEGNSEITVLHLPLKDNERPQDGDKTEGRFLVRTAQFLDPALYEKGTLLTVVGRVSGAESRMIGSFPYLYPALEMIEIKLWPPQQDRRPRLHFGIGVGTSF
jgi:outer membrane lipoprotein